MTIAVRDSAAYQTAPEFLRAVLDSLPTAIVVLDKDLRCLFLNQRAAFFVDVAFAATHVGQKAADLMPDVFPNIASAVEEVFRTGTCSAPSEFEGIMASRPGEPRQWTASYDPISDGDVVIAVSVAFADITERVLAEKKLEWTLLELETIFDVVPVGLAIAHDRECKEVQLNGVYRQMLELPPDAGVEDWYRKPRRNPTLLDGREVDTSEMPLRKAASTGEPTKTARIESFRTDGRRTVLAKASPLVIDDVVTGAVAAYVDITDLANTQDELRAANQVKDDFLAMVSHELRTPLTMILGNAQLLSRGSEAFPDQVRNQLVDETHREAVNLAHIVENLLLMTRIDHGEKLELEPLLLRHICARVIRDFSPDGSEKCRLFFPEEPIVVIGNATSVEQLIRNLVSNAVKYSPTDAVVDVGLEDSGDYVVLKVADRGPGIDASDRERVFEPFFRANASAKRSGMGIGLAVCKRLVESMNGRIWAEPRAEGGGTVFCVTLPKAKADADS